MDAGKKVKREGGINPLILPLLPIKKAALKVAISQP